MAQTVKLKRSSVAAKVPLTTDLALGELAVNTNDGVIYTLMNDGTNKIVQLGGQSVATTVTAGTNAQGQGPLTSNLNVVTVATSNPSGVTLPTALLGRKVYIFNRTVNSVNVYPATGAQIDALTTNVSIQIAANGWLEFNATSTTQWYSSFSASGGGSTPGGSNTQIQFNDGGSTFGGDADLTWNKTTNVMTVTGDVTLNDGTAFTTTLQTITPTAARVINIPDATGTVALVAGVSGQVTYNSSGVSTGSANLTFDGTTLTAVRLAVSGAAAASVSPSLLTGTWFSGGTSTTTKPYFLIEPTGTTSTGWVTTGTGLGINSASGFTGRLLDLQVNGTSEFYVDYIGSLVSTGAGTFTGSLTARPAATQDAVILAGRAGGTSSYGVTLTPTTLTANRTLTLPDTSGTIITSTDIYGWAIAASYGMMMP